MIEVRSAGDADRPGILAVLASVFGERHAEAVDAQWDWRWRRDPRLPEPGYRGAVAVSQGTVVGTVSFLPAAIHAFGQPVGGSWAVDAAVDAAAVRQALRRASGRPGRSPRRSAGGDRQGLFAAMLDHGVGGPAVLGKSVGDRARMVMRRIGFAELAEARFVARNLSVRGRVRRAAGAAAAAVVGVATDPILGRLPSAPTTVVEHEGPFDEAFDRFWDDIAPGYPGIGLRNARVLNWRYRDHPLHDHVVLVDRQGARLTGFAVCRAFPRHGWQRGRIVDLTVARGDVAAARRLVAAALRALRERDVDRVDLYMSGGGAISAALGRLGFRGRSKPSPLLQRWPEPSPEIFVTAGDGDGG